MHIAGMCDMPLGDLTLLCQQEIAGARLAISTG